MAVGVHESPTMVDTTTEPKKEALGEAIAKKRPKLGKVNERAKDRSAGCGDHRHRKVLFLFYTHSLLVCDLF